MLLCTLFGVSYEQLKNQQTTLSLIYWKLKITHQSDSILFGVSYLMY